MSIDTQTTNGRSGATTDLAAAWVAGFAEGWRAPASADAFVAHFRELLAPDIRLIQPQVPPTDGFDAFEREFVRPLFALIEGIHADVERWAADGDTIYVELTLRGTVGRRPLSARVCDRVRLNPDGRAAERETYFDPTPLLGAVARSPRAWPLFLSLRSRRLARLLERSAR
jgi:hypothetical protein